MLSPSRPFFTTAGARELSQEGMVNSRGEREIWTHDERREPPPLLPLLLLLLASSESTGFFELSSGESFEVALVVVLVDEDESSSTLSSVPSSTSSGTRSPRSSSEHDVKVSEIALQSEFEQLLAFFGSTRELS
jgi:hypothetical protein